MRPFLIITVVCVALFIVAGLYIGSLVPTFLAEPPKVSTRGISTTSSIWPLVQNASALVGLLSFLLQVVQWSRGR
jgi:hypothetical protein